MKLKKLFEANLRMTDSDKGAIAAIFNAPTPRMAYDVVTGNRLSVQSREKLNRNGYINVDDDNQTVTLTPKGEEILTSENITDETGQLTDRGKELINSYTDDSDNWKNIG